MVLLWSKLGSLWWFLKRKHVLKLGFLGYIEAYSLCLFLSPERVTKPHRGLEKEDPKRHAKAKEKLIFKKPTTSENKKNEYLPAYLSISTTRES